MRENIIEQLRFCAAHFSCYGCGGDCKTGSNEPRTKAVLNDAADAIEELESYCKELESKVPHWISVEERLPENGKFVLVSDGDDIDTACRYKALTQDEVETFFWDSVLEVTHWMPLPEPPKEDAE